MAKKQPIKFLGIKTTKKGKKILTIVAIVLSLILFDLFSPYFGGNMRLAAEWVRCGNRPYIGDALPGGGVRFYIPAPDLALGRNHIKKYYCTPIEAERDGLSASDVTWDFPHLRDAGENHPYTKKPFLNR